MNVKMTSIIPTLLAISVQVSSAAVTFSGNTYSIISVSPEKNTGLDKIFVLHDTNGVSMSYASGSRDVKWYRYSNLGGGFAEEIAVRQEGNEYVVDNTQGDMGYIIEDGNNRYYYWVVDYSKHPLSLNAVSVPSAQECDNTKINVDGRGDAIHFYTINGQQRTLSRGIEASYETQQWNDNAKDYERIATVKTFDYLQSPLIISPPLYCQTDIKISGDRFLREWDQTQSAEYADFSPNAVDVNTTATQESDNNEDDKSNRLPAGIDGLGGSAPAEISFKSSNTEAVMHHEWQMADDMDFEYITYRITDPDLTYTFTEEGTVYVRYVGSNSDGSCEQYGETYTVSIGASELKCPNAFSPGASEGVNDEWKVSYRSILDFECWIFDRYGNEIFHFTDPDLGWDGKRNGKLVKPGVYYYVIKATGSDGKNYKKSGDINILRYNSFGNQGTPNNPE